MNPEKLIKDLNITGTFEIVTNSDSWFSKALEALEEKEDEQEQ